MAAEPQEKRKKKRRRNPLVRLFIVVALIAGFCYWLTTGFFDVQQTIVENNRHYTSPQIIEKAGSPMWQNIFIVRVNNMRDALLQDPYIRSARVRRELPSTIIITVDERIETAKIPYGERFVVIDNYGIVLRETYAELPLPRLLGLTVRTMNPGRPLEIEETGIFTETLQLLETMERTNMFFSAIDISSIIIRVHIHDNLICIGSPENIMESMINGGLNRTLRELYYTDGIERGVLYVGSDNYFSFSPMVN
jgi:cell division protein FtsQ